MNTLQRSLAVLAVAATVTACGSSGGTDQAADDTSPVTMPSVSATTDDGHAAQAGEPELVQVTGYDYSDDVGPVENICQLFSQDVISSCSAHAVSGLSQGYLIVMGFNPSLQLQGDVAANMLQGMAASGARVKTKTVAGETVALALAGDNKTLVAGWEHGGVMHMVQSDDGKALEDFVTKYVTEQNA
jgi:hypothetical protein